MPTCHSPLLMEMVNSNLWSWILAHSLDLTILLLFFFFFFSVSSLNRGGTFFVFDADYLSLPLLKRKRKWKETVIKTWIGLILYSQREGKSWAHLSFTCPLFGYELEIKDFTLFILPLPSRKASVTWLTHKHTLRVPFGLFIYSIHSSTIAYLHFFCSLPPVLSMVLSIVKLSVCATFYGIAPKTDIGIETFGL